MILKRAFLCGVLLILSGGWPVTGADTRPQPRLAKSGKVLLDENFSSATLPAKWEPGGKTKAFTIVDGALQGVCPPDDGHGPAIGVPLEGQNLTISFAFKHATPGYFLFLVDGDSQYGGQAHLLRVVLNPAQVQIAQDRGSTVSKREQADKKSGGKLPVPTKEQLVDPKFYRTERLAGQPAKLGDGQWHHVLIEMNGNDVLVQVDDQPGITAKGTILDARKSRIVFLVGQKGTTLIDDVKVWENSR